MSVPAATAAKIVTACRAAADANLNTPARKGNIVSLSAENADDVFVSADLHGQRLTFQALVKAADLPGHPRRHLIMQEVCHGGPSYPSGNGCMSHLMLEDVIQLKLAYPERFHFILSNHELAELTDYPICKSRRMLNLTFRCGVQEMYGQAAEEVRAGYLQFLRTLPLAVRLAGGIFISHSLPERVDQSTFDVSILDRPLGTADLVDHGPVFRLMWGRDFRAENAEAFARLVGAELLIHGHEPTSAGFSSPNSRQLILDCCSGDPHYAIVPAGEKLTHEQLLSRVRRLNGKSG